MSNIFSMSRNAMLASVSASGPMCSSPSAASSFVRRAKATVAEARLHSISTDGASGRSAWE